MYTELNQHLYPLVDQLISKVVDEVRENGREISCQAGCSHCCYLLIEITWEEG